jgi:hypothetical protein
MGGVAQNPPPSDFVTNPGTTAAGSTDAGERTEFVCAAVALALGVRRRETRMRAGRCS